MSYDYSVEDMEQYIEYAKKLYDMIRNTFAPPDVKIEKKDNDPLDKYMETISTMVVTMTADTVGKLYFSTLEPLHRWMMHDCAFTGHKAKWEPQPPPIINARK